MLDPLLVEILVDPEDKQPLWYLEEDSKLYNLRLRRAYVIKDGIPVMLIDEALAVDDEEAARLELNSSQFVITGTAALLSIAAELPGCRGAVDSQGMFLVTADLGLQLDEAVRRARGMNGLPDPSSLGAIVVTGMGGSGVAGELLAAYGGSRSSLPVVLTEGYELPSFVGPDTLVFAVSFSGNTEETLATTRSSIERGAKVVAITSGGTLGQLANEPRRALLCGCPPPYPQPRAALGAMAAPLLVCCEELGLLPGLQADLDRAVDQLARRRAELVGSGGGLAGEIARRVGRTVPLIYGAEGVAAVAARRWKTQVNENAKAPAFTAMQPELSHNEICGFGQSGDVTRQVMSVVLLRTSSEHHRIAARFALLSEELREVVADVIEVPAQGDGELAQFFDLVHLGDFVSLHLAVHEGIDPGPVPALVELKEALSRLEEP